MGPFFRLQAGDVFNEREYDHFNTINFGNVDGFSFRVVPVCDLRTWEHVRLEGRVFVLAQAWVWSEARTRVAKERGGFPCPSYLDVSLAFSSAIPLAAAL